MFPNSWDRATPLHVDASIESLSPRDCLQKLCSLRAALQVKPLTVMYATNVGEFPISRTAMV